MLLTLVLFGAWVLRASPFLRPTGVLGWPADYDEGVYLSAAHAFVSGLLPYRDFTFLHPPGLLWALAPFAALEPRQAFGAARWLMTFVGTLNVLLVFHLVRGATVRQSPAAPALLAAVLYAVWPEAVLAERGVFIEPLLNSACLTFMLSLERRWPAPMVGAALAAAICIKVWAVFWVLAALVSYPRQLPRALAWAAGFGLALVGLTHAPPGEALQQTVLTHLYRPPDGDLDLTVRLKEMFVARSVLPAALVLAALPWLWQHRNTPSVRAIFATTTLISLAFLRTPAFWNQYDAHLAAALAPLAGYCFTPWATRLNRLAIAFALFAAVPGARAIIARRHEAAPPIEQRLSRARTFDGHARFCSLSVVDVVQLDRWPVPPLDSYGQQLSLAARSARAATTSEAFTRPENQTALLNQFRQCEVYVESDRDDSQLTDESRSAVRTWFGFAAEHLRWR